MLQQVQFNRFSLPPENIHHRLKADKQLPVINHHNNNGYSKIDPSLLKLYFGGIIQHYPVKESYTLGDNNVSIPEAVRKICRFYTRPIGMVSVYNKTRNKTEDAFIVMGINSGWNELKILNADGTEIGHATYQQLKADLPSQDDQTRTNKKVVKTYTMGNAKNNFFYEGDNYKGVGTAIHKAIYCISKAWGCEGNNILNSMDEKSEGFHRYSGFIDLGDKCKTLYLPQSKMAEFEKEFQNTPIIFKEADLSYDEPLD